MKGLAEIIFKKLKNNNKKYSIFTDKQAYYNACGTLIDLLEEYKDNIAKNVIFDKKDPMFSHLQVHTVWVIGLLINELKALPDNVKDMIEGAEEINDDLD